MATNKTQPNLQKSGNQMDLFATELIENENKPMTTHFTNEFSREVFESTYRYGREQNIDERYLAVAKDIAFAEDPDKQDCWADRFFSLLGNFKFVPGGRILSNAGTGLKGTTYINCFVSGFQGSNQDSMDEIMHELHRQALILKAEGGYGFCVNPLRPRGAFIHGIGGDSPGPVKLLEMWDTQSAVITAGSGLKNMDQKGKTKMRKGAQMVTMSLWHPDIEEFITAKQTPHRLTKFNMSVLASDRFMVALENDQPWHLEFPDFEKEKQVYDQYWNGNLEEWKNNGWPTKIYKTFNSAKELWNLVMRSTYNRNEPGVLFVDTINRLNNLYYLEHINATNPCGEQVLPIGGCCLLGSLNLTQFVDLKNQDWDYDKLKQVLPVAVRFMDNVNERTSVPLPEQKTNLQDKRRIGLGIMGYGSALMMLKIRYGSALALARTEKLGQFIMNEAYKASAKLAKEKGPFKAFDKEKYLGGEFVKGLSSDTLEAIQKYGLRNSHLLSIQPTGNTSVLANNVSGGLEPLFMTEYIRTTVQATPPSGLSLPTQIDWQKKLFKHSGKGPQWTWASEGDESLLVTDFEGVRWKYDSHRGLLKETKVKDYALKFHEDRHTWEPEAPWTATSHELSIENHIQTMAVFSKYIDSAMSKTVNIPNDYPYEDFVEIYQKVYRTGSIKGCTSYRYGTMPSVLAPANQPSSKTGVQQTKATPRPGSLPCDIHPITVKGEKWVVLVGLLSENPYEVFALKQDRLIVPRSVLRGKLVKVKSGVYNLETADGWLLEDISNFFESDEQEALTRMISAALRHGADIEFIVSQLFKSQGTITSFAKAIARTLKQYVTKIKSFTCSECGSSHVEMKEGCFICMDCGRSKCL